MVIDDIKTILDIKDTTKDSILTLYIRKATTLIKNYLLCDDTLDISTTYPDAVIEYVIICMNRRGNEGIKQSSQGSRSQTYTSDLPDSVIALLPVPYAVLINTSPIPTGVFLA